MQIKTSFKFRFFLCGFSGAGKFMADFFAKIFYARQNIFKPPLTDLTSPIQTRASLN